MDVERERVFTCLPIYLFACSTFGVVVFPMVEIKLLLCNATAWDVSSSLFF